MDVIFVDFSYKRQVIEEMLKDCNSLSIYDHHLTAQREFNGLNHPKLKRIVFDMERSGAGIAWDEFVMRPRPPIINFIEDNDLWKFKYQQTKPFVEHLRELDQTFENFDRVHTLCGEGSLLEMFVDSGKAIHRFKMQMVNLVLDRAHEVNFGNYKVWAANVPYVMCSETAHALIWHDGADKPRVFGLTYYFNSKNNKWDISLRSSKESGDFDVSELARSMGGGGHRYAAGVQLNQLPWV